MKEELFQKMIGSMGFQKREKDQASSGAAAGSLMATIAAKKAAKKWKKKS